MDTTQLECLTKKEAAVRLGDHGIPISTLPKSVRSQETDDILREQLEYLIDHVSDKIVPGCSECRRYLRVRSLLLQIFRTSENERAQAREVKATTSCRVWE